ncbi:hypothetical protein GOP47_0004757 [Adiantum capillus-veneris]|uniref:non-specific serine/threonine protein kinase n=1 Tax=Adiantum capillus-veneris TaxID=13818 RepID=A0A9D4V4V2_ADICA|nr:hypothetical protein GOP47_0004757 [Adiantum capillus-veneris]
MGCLPFSSSRSERPAEGDSKFKFSWSIFRNPASAQGKRSSKSAPAISSLPQSNAEPRSSSHLASSSAAHNSIEASSVSSSTNLQQVEEEETRRRDAPCISSDATPLMQSISERTSELQVFTFGELRGVCQGFSRSNLVGEGGFGCVYRGFIKNTSSKEAQSSKEVAVKLLNRNGQQGHKEWLAEVRFLGLVEHPNLVKLVGYCAEDDERGIQRLLVYEFIARGSLEGYLFSKSQSVLSWRQRIQIMLGAARGLAYLHQEIEGIQVIFRDFKTSNVLLDEDFTPKLSDFGLARQGPEMGATHVSTSVVGTIGYAAPEYVQTGHLTSKSDVWSFGVVLFEMLTGRRSVDRNRPKSEQHLLEWVRPYLHGSKKLHLIMDPRFEGDYSLVQAQKIVELALHCCHRAPRARPTMSSVVKKLKWILEDVSSSNAHADVATDKEGSVQMDGHNKEVAPVKRRKLVIEDVKRRIWAPKAISL